MFDTNYIIGDSRKISEIFANNDLERPDLIITSPPYFDVLDYNSHNQQIGFKQSYDEYLSDVVNVLQCGYDLAKDNATLWLVVDTFRRDGELKMLPFDIISRLKQAGIATWKLKELIIWDKEKSMPWNGKGIFKNEFEYIVFLSKGDMFTFNFDSVREINDLKKWWKTYPERYNPSGKAPSNVWSYITPMRGWGSNRQNHLCPFPFPLVEKIISIATQEGDVVLDPFTGSGTVLAIANLMNRKAIGVDVNLEYKKLFEEQVLPGAKKYWDECTTSKKKNSSNYENFGVLNNKLRKLKVASAICQHINKTNDHKFLYVTKENSVAKNSIDIYVMQNGICPKVDLDNPDLKFLIQQAKVKSNIHITKDVDFYNQFMNVQLYKYQFKKFYSYTAACRFPNIGKKEEMCNYIYSDIELKIVD